MFAIRQPYKDEGDNRYYVQRVSYLDYGRFDSEEAAKEHLKFCEEQYSEDLY